MRVVRRIYLAAAATAALALLGGCSVYRSVTNYINSDKPNVCPDAAILASTASLPAFDPMKGEDPSSVLYTIKLTNVTTSCDYDKREHSADTTYKIFYEANRAPGGDAAHYRVPFYTVLTTKGEIKDKQLHWLDFSFERNQTDVTGSEEPEDVEVKPGKGAEPNEYRLVVGFQLTKAQLDYNKKIGRFSP